MKLAICFFGYPRFYNLWWEKFGKFYSGCDVDFYAHFWKDSNVDYTDVTSCFNFKEILVENQKEKFIEIPESLDLSQINKSVFDTLSPLYSLKKLGEIIENISDEYDHFIITRTDVGTISNDSIVEYDLKKDELYFSYVPGNEWLNTHLDARWFCGSSDKLLNLCKVYDNLTNYLNEDKIKLCHHRLFFHSLRMYQEKMNMINTNSEDVYGGWRYIRNGIISET